MWRHPSVVPRPAKACPPGWSHPHEQLLLIAELFGRGLYTNIFCSVVVIFSFISICLSVIWHPTSVSETAAAVFLDGIKDARMKWWENVLLPAKPWWYGKWDCYCCSAEEYFVLERFFLFCLFVFVVFLCFLYCQEALKTGNDFCRQQESSASVWLKEQTSKLKVWWLNITFNSIVSSGLTHPRTKKRNFFCHCNFEQLQMNKSLFFLVVLVSGTVVMIVWKESTLGVLIGGAEAWIQCCYVSISHRFVVSPDTKK